MKKIFSPKDVRNQLESLSRDELNVIARRLRVKAYRRLDQAALITHLSELDDISSQLFPSWWATYHNHVYFAVSISIALLTFLLPSVGPEPETKAPLLPRGILTDAGTTIVSTKTLGQNTVAVLYFEDLSVGNEEPDSLSKVLCTMMISFLSASDNLTIVERVQIQKIYAELELSKSKSFNQQTVARIGELLGARHLVFGSYFFYEDTLRIDARMVDVQTGTTVVSEGATGASGEFSNLLSGVCEKLLGKIDKNVEDWNRELLVRQNFPKEDLEEIGEALDQIDQGQREPAIQRLMVLKEKHPDLDTLISTIISQNVQNN